MSDLLSQFGRQPQTLLTNIGQGVRGLGGQLIQAEKGRKNQEDYDIAEAAWDKDPSKENLRNVYKAAQVLGTLDQTVQTIEAMDTLTQKNRLTRNGQLLASYESGNTQETLRLLEEEHNALLAEGEEAEAKGIQSSIDLINNGEGDIFAKNLKITTGIIPGGQDLLESMASLGKEEREEGEFALKIMQTGFDFEGNQAELDAAVEAGESDPEFGATNLAALNYAKALRGGLGYNPTEFNSTLFSLNDKFQKNANRYFDEVAANRTLNDEIALATKIASGSNVDPMALGQADIAAINTFQRQIDPATVREGDVTLIRQAESLAERFKTMTKGWTTGAVLSVGQRAAMKEISDKIVAAQKAKVDEVYYPASHASFKRVVEEAGRSGNIDELWKEVYSGYTPPDGTLGVEDKTTTIPKIIGAEEADEYTAWLQTMDPNNAEKIGTMSNQEQRRMYKTITERDWDPKQKASSLEGVTITTGEDGEDGEDVYKETD